MTRFGKLFLALLVLAAIGIASIVRLGPGAAGTAPASPPVTEAARQTDAPGALAIPVAGVRAAQLTDMFTDARAGHVHGALDIMARRGTPVVAAMAGTVEKLFDSAAGGTTAYVRSADGRWITYYAHLDGYAPGLREGLYLARGDPVGRVGFTGNASAEGPHLHFEVKRMQAGERWDGGTAVDPYPLLVGR